MRGKNDSRQSDEFQAINEYHSLNIRSKRTRGFLIKVVHNGFQNFEVYHQDYNTYGSILQNFFIWSYNNGIKEIPKWVTEFFEDMTSCHSSFVTDPHFFHELKLLGQNLPFCKVQKIPIQRVQSLFHIFENFKGPWIHLTEMFWTLKMQLWHANDIQQYYDNEGHWQN